MGLIQNPQKVKLIIGFIFRQENSLKKTEGILKSKFGQIDFNSQILDFVHTGYYKSEFGQELKRKFVSFKKLILPQKLTAIKVFTNATERNFSSDSKRTINIDPGYLDLAKLILASTKDHCHRIYLNKGIFAEMTLRFKFKSFEPWEWTYQDYRTQEYISIFNQIREIYRKQIIIRCTRPI